MDERLTFGYGTSNAVGQPSPPVAAADVAATAPAPSSSAPIRRSRDWAFTSLMAFTALLYLRPQDTIPALAVVPWAELAAITGLVTMAFGRLRHGLPLSRVTPELLGVVALGGVILLTAPLSIWPGGAVMTFRDLYAKVVLIFILMVNTLTSPERVRQFTWMVVATTSYIAFRAVFDYARGFNLIENGRVMGAVGGMFQNPNDLALNMVAILPLAVLLAMRTDSLLKRLFAVGGGFLMIGATVASQSRSGFLALAAMMLFLAFLIGRKSPRIVVAGAVALLLCLPLVPDSYWQRMASITDESRDESGSREARRILLREAWDAFLAHPLTGVGAGNFKAYKPRERNEPWMETHNVLLQVASELGIGGIMIFLFLVYRAAFAARQTRRLLLQALGFRRKRAWNLRPAPPPAQVVTLQEAAYLDAHGAAMTAAIAGWFFSALFASVAYNWTFYYLLALAIVPREILRDRLAGRSAPGASVVRRARTPKTVVPAEVRV